MFKRTALFVPTAALLMVSAFAGDLAPAGPPSPTMKTLVEVEPRQFIRQADTPLTIVAPGSYYLAEHLIATSTGETAITVLADDVTIDLNGFSIRGSEVGVWDYGIVTPGDESGIVVRNGTVRDCVFHGIDIRSSGPNDSGLIEQVKAIDNGFIGILVGENSLIKDSVAMGNQGGGFQLTNAKIVNSTASGNANAGIIARDGSIVERCNASGNTNVGIELHASTAKDNNAHENQTGIETGVGRSTIVGNFTNDNSYAGIRAPFGSGGTRIDGNEAADNGSIGISCGHEGSIVVRNLAHDNGAQNYSIAAGVAVGAILDVTGSTITTTNPWRNLEF